MALVDEAVTSGCRFTVACGDLEMPVRTIRRWKHSGCSKDARRGPLTTPHNKLSPKERQKVLTVCNEPEYCDLTPRIIVAMLADKDEYVASEATMYRILREEQMLNHRQVSKVPVKREPNTHAATKPNQLWSWDITFLASKIRGQFYKGYVFMDIYSRKIVGADVFETESSEHARDLLASACASERIQAEQLTLHSDNGAPMKGCTLLAFLRSLSVLPSYSRPSVSNDNAFSESLFRTMKYIPSYPRNGFSSIEEAQAWLQVFVRWYNFEHLHSGLKYVTPHQRHAGHDKRVLQSRRRVYEAARKAHPNRWTGSVRDWSPLQRVVLNGHRQKAA